MKILFWTDGFWPRIGGIETQAIQLIEAMQKRTHQYLVIAQKDHPEWRDKEAYLGISIVRFDFKGMIHESRVIEFEPMKNIIKNILDTFKPDLIHLNTSVGEYAYIFLMFQKIFTVPVILTLHSVCLDNKSIPFIMKKILNAADKICCVSKSVSQLIQTHSPEHIDKTVCIYNGLALPDILPSPLPFDPPILLCLGRLSPEKGFHFVLMAAVKLMNDNYRFQLVIAGEGPERDRLFCLAKELRLQDRVSFIGAVKFSDVPELINNSTIVLTPSTEESFGLVALEAAQMQRPVITSNAGGLPEVVIHDETGIVFPAGSVSALTDAIKSLFIDSNLAEKFGINARKRALNTFTLTSLTEEYHQLYLSQL